MSVFTLRRGAPPSYGPVIPVGTTWLFEEDGEWECPADGQYQIEMHGGGGGAAISYVNGPSRPNFSGASGGGSGEVYTKSLAKGSIYNVVIGTGGSGATKYASSTSGAYGTYGGNGGTTSFGDLLSIGGGGGGYAHIAAGQVTAGTKQGSLATAGTTKHLGSAFTLAGGQGNSSNASQTYGDGGGATAATSGGPKNGQPGAVIITYLGA